MYILYYNLKLRKTMKKLLLIISVLAMFATTLKAQSRVFSQVIEFNCVNRLIWDDEAHPIRRTPPRECSLPEVYFDNASSTIAFVGGEGGSAFTYYILDAAGNILLTSPLALASDEEASVSLTTLSPATYTIVLYINGRYYEGEIEL